MFEQITGASPNFVSWKDKLHGQAPKPNHIHFSKAWPGTNKWARDSYFEIEKTAYVDYRKSYTLPGSDYKELDLSNATSGLNLYPETDEQVHEILVGFKPGNYIVQIDVPNGSPLGKLPEASMIPSKTDSDLKYLNAKNPEDSPPESPTLKFWAIKDMPAIILRPITLSGQDFERVTITFKVAKHLLKQIPANVDASGNKIPPVPVYDRIFFPTEEQWS